MNVPDLLAENSFLSSPYHLQEKINVVVTDCLIDTAIGFIRVLWYPLQILILLNSQFFSSVIGG
jgi:hypothetical protein